MKRRASTNVIPISGFRRDHESADIVRVPVSKSSEVSKLKTTLGREGNHLVYLSTKKGERFSIAPDAVARRPNHGGSIEESALVRLLTILRNSNETPITVFLPGQEPQVTAILRSSFPSANFFKIRAPEAFPSTPSKVSFAVNLFGMRFSFESESIEVEGDAAVFTLPKVGYRRLTRGAPRKSGVPLRVQVARAGSKLPGELVDLSASGMAISVPDSGLKVGDCISLEVDAPGPKSFELRGLVVGIARDLLHLSVSVSKGDRKLWLTTLLEHQFDGISVGYDADRAWRCLEEFGYLDLLDSEEFRRSNEACRKNWKKRERKPEFFQPVACLGEELGGTYGIVEVTAGHWVQQCLSTKVDPRFLNVTAALYGAWPQYLLAANEPVWITTQFDSEKRWHNRFFSVFASEVANNPLFSRFVRHWHWTPSVPSFPKDKSVTMIPISRAPKKIQNRCETILRDYSKVECPMLSLEERRSGDHLCFAEAVFHEDKFMGFILFITSAEIINPFSVFHVGHVFAEGVTPEDRRKNTEILASAANERLRKLGLKSCAITHEYDVDPTNMLGSEYMYFCASEFQTHTEDLIPQFLSVAALNLAEMRVRNAG